MFAKLFDFLRRIPSIFKNFFIKLGTKIRPRATKQWFGWAFAWLLILIYIGYGIYVGIQVYKYHSDLSRIETSVKFYPLPAVIVNGNIIWANSYYQQLKYIQHFSAKTGQQAPNSAVLKKQITDQLIENDILAVAAIKNHITVSTKDVNDAYQKIVDQSGGVNAVKKVLSDLYGMNEADFKKLVRQQVLKEKIQNNLMMQIKVSHILIKDEGTANTIATKAKAGEDFAGLAKQYSEDTKSAPSGGELGFIAKGQFVVNNNSIPEFDSAAFSAKKGDIVGPIKTTVGFEIIKIEDIKGKINESFDSWLAEQKNQAKIWTFIK